MNSLKTFMDAASGDEQEELAAAANTSRAYLYRLANSGASYARVAKAELAAAIEEKTASMSRSSKGRLPTVYRTDLNAACRECPYASRCLGSKALAAQFQVLEEHSGLTD